MNIQHIYTDIIHNNKEATVNTIHKHTTGSCDEERFSGHLLSVELDLKCFNS